LTAQQEFQKTELESSYTFLTNKVYDKTRFNVPFV